MPFPWRQAESRLDAACVPPLRRQGQQLEHDIAGLTRGRPLRRAGASRKPGLASQADRPGKTSRNLDRLLDHDRPPPHLQTLKSRYCDVQEAARCDVSATAEIGDG